MNTVPIDTDGDPVSSAATVRVFTPRRAANSIMVQRRACRPSLIWVPNTVNASWAARETVTDFFVPD